MGYINPFTKVISARCGPGTAHAAKPASSGRKRGAERPRQLEKLTRGNLRGEANPGLNAAFQTGARHGLNGLIRRIIVKTPEND